MFKQLHAACVAKAPQFLRHPAKLMPFRAKQQLLLPLLNRLFAEAIEEGDLDFLSDRWLKLEVTDLDVVHYISFVDNALVMAEQVPQFDVSFSANTNDLILVAGRKEDPDTLFFQRRLRIEGDTELGLELKNLMDNIDWQAMPSYMSWPLVKLSGFVEQGMAHQQSKAMAL
ncbi:Ubiquinone biosynthesis accessory factor UbiJ [Vibrio stylophorae]|uniref:Ubiquinone biosynthesis accessory factor UbiT n=1 Tax=Vibrio stylophorae TaxID=659351 RepID=A0ABM8ZVF9_9VIBR|nr:SCP2 sterol-binding domain-containing protein [Vibrio stylophorae]CAH0534318.1 Ubiquinone biosynthesis accessory factor UbiJ [Vibrio stylophorae]